MNPKIRLRVDLAIAAGAAASVYFCGSTFGDRVLVLVCWAVVAAGVARLLSRSQPTYCLHSDTDENGRWECRNIAALRCRSGLCSECCYDLLCYCLEEEPR